jgi:hypothetical protein
VGKANRAHDRDGKYMIQVLDDLCDISRNIHARVNDRMAENPDERSAEAHEIHWLTVLQEELELAEEEAELSNRVAPETFRAGYNQGWFDAIRVILDARHMIRESIDQPKERIQAEQRAYRTVPT